MPEIIFVNNARFLLLQSKSGGPPIKQRGVQYYFQSDRPSQLDEDLSSSDLLMIVLQLRPQQDFGVISFFIQKDDRSIRSWSATPWLETRYAVLLWLRWNELWHLLSGFSGCTEFDEIGYQKHIILCHLE